MNPVYRYSINGYPANPIIGSNVSKDYEHDNGQRYFRAKLNGKLKFVGSDFDYLHAQSFSTNFVLLIERLVNGTWVSYFTGKFNKTDCRWDYDNRFMETNIITQDSYTDVLAGLDKEFNLIKLNPSIEPVIINKRPLIQVYIPGNNTISCFLGGTYFEQDADEINSTSDLVSIYKFALMTSIYEFNVTGTASPAAVVSAYTNKIGEIYSNYNGYKMTYASYPEEDQFGQPTGNTVYDYRIVRLSDNQEMFKSVGLGAPFLQDVEMAPVSGSGATGSLTVFGRQVDFYGRYLLDVDTLDALSTYDIPADDIAENNRNYKKCLGYSGDLIAPYSRYTTTPNEYGLNDYGTYFLPPYSPDNHKFYPVARSKWTNASYWFEFDLFDSVLEAKGRKPYLLKDSYKVSDVISILLANIAPTISHQATSDYSQFLYNSYNPISSQIFTLMLTQKSNITSGDYDKPAQKAMITLNDVLTMLKDVYHCYWFIEDNKLKIEHILWFNKGGTYSGSGILGCDLTTAIDIKTNKPWSFSSNSWQFDKDTLQERIQFNWMDDVTEGFDGYPIDVISPYITKGNIESVQIQKFTTDIDYMLLNPSAITKDGFALMAAIKNNLFNIYDSDNRLGYKVAGGSIISDASYNTSHLISVFEGIEYEFNTVYTISWYNFEGTFISTSIPNGSTIKAPIYAKYCRVTTITSAWNTLAFKTRYSSLPFVEKYVDGAYLLLQNGYLSWISLQPTYHIYDLPASLVNINKVQVSALGITKGKKQEVSFPSDNDPHPLMLIKTGLGNGLVDKISINLASRMNKITLAYDTE